MRRARVIAAALSALVGCAAASGPSAARAGDFWERVRSPHLRAYRARVLAGREALAESRFEAAVAEAEAAVALDPDRAAAYVLRARALVAAGGPGAPGAVEAVRDAVARDPGAFDEPSDVEAATRAAALAGDLALATQVLGRAVSRMPQSARQRPRFFLLLGDLLLARGPEHVREAIVALREAQGTSADDRARARLGLALALRRAGRGLEAQLVVADLVVQPHLVESTLGGDRALLPLTEVAARAAIAQEVVGDVAAAAERWRRAAEGGPWAAQARAEADALSDPRSARDAGPPSPRVPPEGPAAGGSSARSRRTPSAPAPASRATQTPRPAPPAGPAPRAAPPAPRRRP
jgi:tetratricopeptide (TPR) repeat protein